jgi:hypothetical protein
VFNLKDEARYMDNEELRILRKIAEASASLCFAQDNPEFAKFCGRKESELKYELESNLKDYQSWIDEN